MRLNNLSAATKEDIKRGNRRLLEVVIKEELEGLKEDLIDLPLDKIEGLRGSARTLRLLLELLGE